MKLYKSVFVYSSLENMTSFKEEKRLVITLRKFPYEIYGCYLLSTVVLTFQRLKAQF